MEETQIKVLALNADKIKNIKDVRAVLKALNIGITEEYVVDNGLEHLMFTEDGE